MPDCSKCHNPELARDWGCKGPSTAGFRYNIGGEIVTTCPYSMIKKPVIREGWRLYSAYKRGVTPNGKGLSQETAYYGWMMEQFESLDVQVEPWYLNRREELGIKDG